MTLLCTVTISVAKVSKDERAFHQTCKFARSQRSLLVALCAGNAEAQPRPPIDRLVGATRRAADGKWTLFQPVTGLLQDLPFVVLPRCGKFFLRISAAFFLRS